MSSVYFAFRFSVSPLCSGAMQSIMLDSFDLLSSTLLFVSLSVLKYPINSCLLLLISSFVISLVKIMVSRWDTLTSIPFILLSFVHVDTYGVGLNWCCPVWGLYFYRMYRSKFVVVLVFRHQMDECFINYCELKGSLRFEHWMCIDANMAVSNCWYLLLCIWTVFSICYWLLCTLFGFFLFCL